MYATLYRRVREAADRYDLMIGLTMGPDFSKYTLEEITEYIRVHRLKDSDVGGVRIALEAGDQMKVRRLMVMSSSSADVQVKHARRSALW